MSAIELTCPFCQATLRVPREHANKKGRCRVCKAIFSIAAVLEQQGGGPDVNEDSVVGWLGEDPVARLRTGLRRQARAEQQAQSALKPHPASPADAPAADQAPQPPTAKAEEAPRPAVRLGHVDDMGAFFLFPPELLYDEHFRLGLPRRCMICGHDEDLLVHLVIWSSKLPERGHFGVHTSYAKSVFDLKQMGAVGGPELLKMLPVVENLPEPYSLPMPYFVCRGCSAVGAIVTDVRYTGDGNVQVCELGICSLQRALEFAEAVCADDGDARRRIQEAIQQSKDNAWKALPVAVRSRIKHWYEPAEDERFLAYIADEDFSKSEAGMAGLVVTDRRLVYRKFAARAEIPLSQPITIVPRSHQDRPQLEISAPSCKPVVLSASEATICRLRRHLQEQGIQAEWSPA